MKSEFSRRQFHAVGPAHPHRMPGCRVVVYVVRVGSDWNISWSTHLRRYEQCSFSGCLLSEMPGSDQLFTNQFKLLAVCLLRIWSKKTRESIALTAWRQIAEAAKLTSYLWDFVLVCFVNYRLTREKVGTNAEIFFFWISIEPGCKQRCPAVQGDGNWQFVGDLWTCIATKCLVPTEPQPERLIIASPKVHI